MKRLLFLLGDVRLSLHWHYIRKLRRKAAVLIDKGTCCFHPDLVRYSNKILRHGMTVAKIWNSRKPYNLHPIDIDEAEQMTGMPAITA